MTVPPLGRPLASAGAAALLTGFLLAATTLAQPVMAASAPQRITLADRLPRGIDGVLRGHWDRLELPLIVPAGLDVKGVTLTLGHTSAAEAGPGSRLWLGLDGVALVQLPLGLDGVGVSREITLPTTLFTPGRHTLGIAVVHDSGLPGAVSADRLWTALDLGHSSLKLDVGRLLAPVTLAAFGDRLAAGLVEEGPLSILSAASPAQTEPQAGALAVEGWALRLGRKPVSVRYAQAQAKPVPPGLGGRFPGLNQDRLAGRHHILIGTRDQLAPLLSAVVTDAITGPTLAIYPLDADPEHAVLVIAGRDGREVTRAAAIFAETGHPLPEAALARVGNQPPILRAAIPGDRTYRLADLGYTPPADLSGFLEPAGITLNLPIDLLPTPADRVTLRLHLDHGRVETGQSAVNLLVNGEVVGAAGLRDRKGGAGHYDISLPLTAFRPGHNHLTITPAAAGGGGPQRFRVFADSTLKLPPWQRAARQPDLKRFAATGFPMVQPDDTATDLIAADASPETLAATWMVAGKLAQVAGGPLPSLDVRLGTAHPDRHALVIGPAATLPASRAATARTPDVPLADSALQGLYDTLVDATLAAVSGEPAPTTIEQTSEPFRVQPGGVALTVSAGRDNHDSDKTLTVISASDPATLLAGVERLIQPAIWDELSGGRATLGPDHRLTTAPPEETFVTGSKPSWTALPPLARRFLALRPDAWTVTVALVLVVFSQVVWRCIRRTQRREVGFDF
ncbi:MAG TPA: cellulose biosynthesis cyclic di-GMP-binding regulatory protein BcsB [Azospirillaceae bacterium]|nr:cellulose biosynthesis cyclic di-GMP-binding regulatory protein BcsB [Azospirillaceae bacterium]